MFSKSIVHQLKIGETITVTIKEVLDDSYLIVSLEGHLLRIHNETGQSFELEEQIKLRVRTIRPLSFRWAQSVDSGEGYSQVV